jgi:hypothetical protein
MRRHIVINKSRSYLIRTIIITLHQRSRSNRRIHPTRILTALLHDSTVQIKTLLKDELYLDLLEADQ